MVELETPLAPKVDLAETRRLRAIEVCVILGALAVVFAAFVAVQVRYLFGGREVVETMLELTYAEYARRGFFELVAVAALLLPVLLGVAWAMKREQSTVRAYRASAIILVAPLFAIMGSAVQRMLIYTETYGLTELRVYAVASLVLLAAVFVWLSVAVVRWRMDTFAPLALTLPVVAVVCLAFVNPDERIATTNLRRAAEGKPLDAEYLTGLSADAVPAILAGFDDVPPEQRCFVARVLIADWGSGDDEWRSWNRARSEARQALRSHRAELQAACIAHALLR
jgi:hypothetical protein